MIIPTHFGPAGPLWRVQAWQAWAFNRLALLDLIAVDLRLALVTIATRSLVQTANALVRRVMGRAWRGARFAQDITAAASMVAAARR